MNIDNTIKEFMFIGTTLYRKIEQPLADGMVRPMLMGWDLKTLSLELGDCYKMAVKKVPRYKGFANIPNHTSYQREINGFYNRYEPLSHIPIEGEWNHIRSLVEHIFGDQYEKGIDYLQLLYMQPIQKLPILLLVSAERNTGKTTFLNFLKEMFQENVTFNSNEDFRSQFNSEWVNKLIIMVDEALLNRAGDSEHFKFLSTTRSSKSEAKGKDRMEVPFYGKFVLCSNNENNPVDIDNSEIRYWVRKVTPLSHDDVDFLSKLRAEIPAFLFFLQNRQLSTECKSRMWFSQDDIHTEALDKIVEASKNHFELDIADLLKDIMVKEKVETVEFTLKDICDLLRGMGVEMAPYQARNVLERWGVRRASNSLTYTKYQFEYNTYAESCYTARPSCVGRFYTVTADDLKCR